jgi:glycogen(starch) synthase
MDKPANPCDGLRVLMTTDAVGGVWRYSVDLATKLARCGAKVQLASLGPRPSAQQKRDALGIDGISLAEGEFALEWMPEPWQEVDAAGAWLLDLQSEFGAHIIHLNGYSHAALEWRRPVVSVAHSCVVSWWQAVHGCAPGPEWDEYRRRVTAGLRAAGGIVAPSRFMAAAVQQHYGVSAEKLSVIHNFSRARIWPEIKKEPFILAAGRLWDQAKNVAILEKIAPKLDWEIRLAGSGQEADYAPVVTKKVRFLGDLPHPVLMRYMEGASIFAHPAFYEPFGISVLEAARAGCCLVLAAIPSLEELWEGAAIFVDPRNSEAWVRELNDLARDPLRVRKYGRLAYAQSGKYRPKASVSKYVTLYRSLIESSAGKEAAA